MADGAIEAVVAEAVEAAYAGDMNGYRPKHLWLSGQLLF